MVKQNLNSYTLERLNRTPIPGNFSARRLRRFIPREGTKLAEEQAEVEQKMAKEKMNAADEETMERKETKEEDEDRCPQNEDKDTRECQTVHQATRTPPHGGGAHGVVGKSDKSHDQSCTWS